MTGDCCVISVLCCQLWVDGWLMTNDVIVNFKK